MNLLLVDYLNTIIRSLAVNKELTSGELSTGGVYGFITQLSYYINEYDPDCIILCKDKRPYLREIDFPNYKKDRKERQTDDKDEFFKMLSDNCTLVNEFLELTDIPLYEIKGLEADDLIAACVKDLHEEFNNIYILCNDSDLFQLLNYDNVGILKKDHVYRKKDLLKDPKYLGATPENWIEATSLSGTHNNVPGIPRVGVKTALKILSNEKKLEEILKVHKELFERNKKLITLPYPLYKELFKIPIKSPSINENKLIQWMARYGINYTTRMHEAFSRYPHNIAF